MTSLDTLADRGPSALDELYSTVAVVRRRLELLEAAIEVLEREERIDRAVDDEPRITGAEVIYREGSLRDRYPGVTREEVDAMVAARLAPDSGRLRAGIEEALEGDGAGPQVGEVLGRIHDHPALRIVETPVPPIPDDVAEAMRERFNVDEELIAGRSPAPPEVLERQEDAEELGRAWLDHRRREELIREETGTEREREDAARRRLEEERLAAIAQAGGLEVDAEPVRPVDDDDQADGPAPAPPAVPPTAAAPAPRPADSTRDEQDLPPLRDRVLAVYREHAGDWLRNRDVELAVEGSTAEAIRRETGRLRAEGTLEHNGKAGSAGRTRAPIPEETGRTVAEAAEQAGPGYGHADKIVGRRTVEPQEDGTDKVALKPLAVALAEAAGDDRAAGKHVEGRVLESIRYRPATVTELAERLRLEEDAERVALAGAVARLVKEGEIERAGYAGDRAVYRMAGGAAA